MPSISFKPKQVTKRLLAALPSRSREVLTHRYGLGTEVSPRTLEAIGSMYGITRERVRQIENHALLSVRKSDAFAAEESAFNDLRQAIEKLGDIVAEQDLLSDLAKDASTRNHLQFLLAVGEMFKRKKEDAEFHHRWYIDEDLANRVHDALRDLYKSLTDEELIPEADLIRRFFEQMRDLNEQYKEEEIARRWLGLSKLIDRNPLGEWGIATSPNVRAKGMRDYAYLTIKRHGSPMHFTEVAGAIEELFKRKAHVATCHNELIKDPRFVLVGRGLYALSEWGYSTGVVKDVIREILRSRGALTRDEIVDLVKKERYVKDNTILVNLQDTKTFVRDKSGRYALAE